MTQYKSNLHNSKNIKPVLKYTIFYFPETKPCNKVYAEKARTKLD